MPSLDLLSIAREVKHAQDHALALTPFTARYADFDIPAAYEVARLVHEQRLADGIKPVGRKIGFTNSAIWEQYGVGHPVWAYVYNTTVIQTSSNQATCQLSRFVAPRIEPEIIVHFHSKPTVTTDLSKILECIDWIASGFEIVQSHFADWKFAAADTIANSGLHACLLVGKQCNVASLGLDVIQKLEQFSLSIHRNDQLLEVGCGSNVLGNPLSALAHLLTTIARQPNALQIDAGEIVTTGTVTKAYPIASGEVWGTHLEGIALSGLSVTFTN